MEFSFDHLLTADGLIRLLTLSVLEIVLGIDNIIFISIIAGKLPRTQQGTARMWGLSLALIMRVILLSGISFIASMTAALFSIGDFGVTGRDLILFAGGVFLIYKTTVEIIEKLADKPESPQDFKERSLFAAIIQIVLIDIVFSFDSILTAVGVSSDLPLAQGLPIMIGAVIISMIIMMIFSGKVSDFINRNPSIKMLALAFLILIGVILVVEALHVHVDKTYIYVAMGFSLVVEMLNMRMRKVLVQHEKHHLPNPNDPSLTEAELRNLNKKK
jgi:predicted tellurium resistance membrane protein TerC